MNSFRTVFTPSSSPIFAASCQGTPSTPGERREQEAEDPLEREARRSPTSPPAQPSSASAMWISATNATSMPPMLSASRTPSIAPGRGRVDRVHGGARELDVRAAARVRGTPSSGTISLAIAIAAGAAMKLAATRCPAYDGPSMPM